MQNSYIADCSYILSQATMMHDMTAAAIVILVSCCIAAGGTPVPGRITPTGTIRLQLTLVCHIVFCYAVLEATTLGGSETTPVPSLIPGMIHWQYYKLLNLPPLCYAASPAPGTIQAPTPPSHDRVWVVVGQQMLPVQLCFLVSKMIQGREVAGYEGKRKYVGK